MKKAWLLVLSCWLCTSSIEAEVRDPSKYTNLFGSDKPTLYSVIPYYVEDGKVYLIFGQHKYSDGTQALSGYVDIFLTSADFFSGGGQVISNVDFFQPLLPNAPIKIIPMGRGNAGNWVMIPVDNKGMLQAIKNTKLQNVGGRLYALQAPGDSQVVELQALLNTQKKQSLDQRAFIDYDIGGNKLTFLKDFVQLVFSEKRGELELSDGYLLLKKLLEELSVQKQPEPSQSSGAPTPAPVVYSIENTLQAFAGSLDALSQAVKQ